MRNPALNIASMTALTDIPDWTYAETGITYDPAKPPTAEALTKCLSHSPITLADKVCVCVAV